MKTNLILLIILASISNITYGQCNDLDKAIANYEMHLVGKRTDKFERIKYQKAYLVATNICSCDHANSSDIFLAERILNKLYSVSATFSFEKERLDEALEFCEASYLVIHSSDSNDSSSIFNQDYSISFFFNIRYFYVLFFHVRILFFDRILGIF